MEIDRREFLQLLGVAAAGITAGVVGGKVLLSMPEEVFERAMSGPRIESWKNSICSLCPGGCGIRVRLIDDIPVRIKGNPLYPINRGYVCPVAEAGIEMLFHPKRLRQPLKRNGKRGENQWEPITWDEALETISNRLQNLRDQGNPERVVMVTQNNHNQITELSQRFMNHYGSPNFFCLDESLIRSLPVLLTQGLNQPPVYDLANANFILNFGNDLLDEGPSPIHFNQLYAKLKNRQNENRARIVHVSSYLSRTAANSSEWIPIKPGTMAALALSIANVMIRYGSYDKDFINEQSFGFSDWKDTNGTLHKGFKTLVSEEYYPEKVASITGISARKIVETAREFASARTAIAFPGGQATNSTNSLYTSWAIYCLNALKGNIEKPGGVLFSKEMNNVLFPETITGQAAKKGLDKPKIGSEYNRFFPFTIDSFNQLTKALSTNQSYAIDTLILHQVNPLYFSTDQKQCLDALQQVPFLVSCTSFIDDTASYADLILPEHLFLEKWEINQNNPAVNYLHVGIQQPIIEPLYETKHFGDVLLHVGKSLGGSLSETFSWENYESYVKAYSQAIFNSGEGTIISESTELSWIEFLKKRGWQAFDYATFEEFWDLLLENGGWWDPSPPAAGMSRILKSKSGKFEFYSQTLKNEVAKLMPATDSMQIQVADLNRYWNINARSDSIFLPHYEVPRFHKESIDFPYHFLSFQLLTNINGKAANSPLLHELFGLHSRQYWNSWVEMNPQTAERFNIHEDDYVNIISFKGRLTARVKILPTVMPEVIMMSAGLGQRLAGSNQRPIGVNPYEIFGDDSDLMCGIPSLISTKISIEKAKIRDIT